MPRGSRPSTAALLHLSRAAICSALVTLPVTVSHLLHFEASCNPMFPG
jgi:hypothetical protein